MISKKIEITTTSGAQYGSVLEIYRCTTYGFLGLLIYKSVKELV